MTNRPIRLPLPPQPETDSMLVDHARMALRFLGVPEDDIVACGKDLVKLDRLAQTRLKPER